MAKTSNFEVHIGFPGKAAALCKDLVSGQEKWKVKEAIEVVTGVAAHGMIDPHDVPGELSKLATRRFTNLHDALKEANRVALRCVADQDIRIELEEVLLTQEDDTDGLIARFEPYTAGVNSCSNGTLIADTPPFEIHLGVRMSDDSEQLPATDVLTKLAEGAGIPVHQAVRFVNPTKVILTTFFDGYDQMVQKTHSLGRQFRKALNDLNPNLRLKLVAERILFCLQPGSYSPGPSVSK